MSRAEEGSAREFLAEAEDNLEALAADLLSLESSVDEEDPDPEVINSIFRGAHSLKGLSGMFGYHQITDVAHQTESLLDALRMGKVACQSSVRDLLFEAVDLLKLLCSRLAAGEVPEDPRVEPFLERLLTAARGQSTTPDNGISALGLPDDVLQMLTEYELHRIEETFKNQAKKLLRIAVSFPLETFDTDLQSLNDRLKSCGEVISTLPTPGPADGDHLDFELLVGAKVGLEEVRAATEPAGARVEILDPAAEPGTRFAEGSGGCRLRPAAIEPTEPEDEPASLAPSATASRPARRAESELRSLTKTVRVDLPKLDNLMNLVGELVLAKGRVQIVADRLRSRLDFGGEILELSRAQKELERKLSDLQQAVMDVRMVPVGQLFSKLHRVMRKILQGSSKEVNLELAGTETELDKLIVEDLSDPLIHVIRNAVDHGIENPETRLASGKPAQGTVRIEARQRGHHVVIDVTDDGAGISREKILKKAIERGLLPEGAQPEDKDLFDLTFLPGFSTKNDVTEISGRGVGMDVLRKNIASLSGMIELTSQEGRGTTVSIVLPITLAIIQALLVNVENQIFSIPLNSVLETLALEPAMIKALEGRPILRLRDDTVPLVRIHELFGTNGSEALPRYAVVVGVPEKRVAFGVDDLMSQQDVVIKTLGPRLQKVKGLAGATDLGDQSTILVLDVGALVDEVFATG